MPHVLRYVFAVVNPASGNADVPSVLRLLDECRNGLNLDVHELRPNDDAASLSRAAVERGADAVVAVGGDGTVSRVVEAVEGTGAAVGIVPAGTGNIVARSLGIPSDPRAAVRLLVQEHAVRKIDLVRVGERASVLSVSAGISASAVEIARPFHKRRFGRLAYVMGALAATFDTEPRHFEVTVDGRRTRIRATEISIVNCDPIPELSPPWKPDISMDDGVIHVFAIRAPSPREFLDLARSAWVERNVVGPFVAWFEARDLVVVETDEPVQVQVDGEVAGTTPVRAEVLPGRVAVIVPRASRGRVRRVAGAGRLLG